MNPFSRRSALLAWLALSLAGGVWLFGQRLAELNTRFYQDTSITHRLLSQRATQHEAVLATLALEAAPREPARLLAGLQPALPGLVALGRIQHGVWRGSAAPPPGLAAAVHRASTLRHPVALPAEQARYWLVDGQGQALLIDADRLLAPDEWPAALGNLTLQLPQGRVALLHRQPNAPRFGWPQAVDKPLGAKSQPFPLQSRHEVGLAEWPWGRFALWAVLAALLVGALYGWRQGRANAARERERARLARVARLNTLGEMAAGLAHELNQPLTAILAHVRAAERLLDDEDERDTVRQALQTSAAQARRAADIIARLRALVEPGARTRAEPVDVDALLGSLRFLLGPELAERRIALSWHDESEATRPLADPVALEQIVHNLLGNAIEALLGAPGERRITVSARRDADRYRLSVADNGPGIPPEHLPHLFEPFFTTRDGGLGLGLPLCETLAGAMDGRLTAANAPAGGACFTLSLPLAKGAQ
ncbi:ATP-binding protein [Neisseriaceae bacterium JH1-16]|nr:ATP-binding protein [Neisseriaceae bacterium JH1-16]